MMRSPGIAAAAAMRSCAKVPARHVPQPPADHRVVERADAEAAPEEQPPGIHDERGADPDHEGMNDRFHFEPHRLRFPESFAA